MVSPQWFPRAVWVSNPTNSEWGFSFPTLSSAFAVSCFVDLWHYCYGKMKPKSCFDCIFSFVEMMNIFEVYIRHFKNVFQHLSINVSGLFPEWEVRIFILLCLTSLYILNIYPLWNVYLVKILSFPVGFPFIWLMISLSGQNLFSFKNSYISICP